MARSGGHAKHAHLRIFHDQLLSAWCRAQHWETKGEQDGMSSVREESSQVSEPSGHGVLRTGAVSAPWVGIQSSLGEEQGWEWQSRVSLGS